MPAPPRRFTPAHLLAAIVLVLALGWFTVRTAPRGGYWMWDFGMVSEASRAWLDGRNPYDEGELRKRWRAQPVPGLLEHIDHVESLLPPPTLMVMSPLALLPRGAALWVWYAVQWALLIGAIGTLCSLANRPALDPRAMLLAAGVLLLGPVQSGVQAGQLSLPATACIVLALALDVRGRPIVAGCLLALAMALKLQLAAPFIVYFALCSRWRIVFAAACLFAGITLLAIIRLELADVDWMSTWLANVRRSTGAGGLNDFAAGVAMDHLLNLQLPLYAVTGNRAAAQIGALALVSIAAIVYALRLRRAADGPTRNPLPLIAPLAVLTLLPVYHRYYDATLLIIPLAWAVARFPRSRAALVLALLIPFILPVGWATNLVNRGLLPPSVTPTTGWRILIMPFQVWLLAALAIALIAAMPPPKQQLT